MEYFAGLDISMNETHICVVDRDGRVALFDNCHTVALRCREREPSTPSALEPLLPTCSA
jgi:hypothetical protein